MTTLHINGRAQQVDLPDETPLLWALRDELGHTGTKFGCGMALCGACTVHANGNPIRFTDPDGNVVSYTYAERGLPATVTDQDGDVAAGLAQESADGGPAMLVGTVVASQGVLFNVVALIENGAVTESYSADREVVINLLNEALATRDRAGTLVNRGVMLMRGKSYNDAARDFEDAIRLSPELGDTLAHQRAVIIVVLVHAGRPPDHGASTMPAWGVPKTAPEKP